MSQNGQRYSKRKSRMKSASSTSAQTRKNFRYKKMLSTKQTMKTIKTQIKIHMHADTYCMQAVLLAYAIHAQLVASIVISQVQSQSLNVLFVQHIFRRLL